jgi:hypothetical protein
VALILVVWLPLLVFVGGPAWLWFEVHRAEVAAGEARAAVRIGDTLGAAIISSGEVIGGTRLLQCYEASCAVPQAIVIASRLGDRCSVHDADGSMLSVETLEDWRREILRSDRTVCRLARITFCGRPRITFDIAMDEAGRITQVGALRVTAD